VEKEEIISSGILELYAAGAASPEEAAQVAGWCAQYPEVAAELLSIEKAMEAYAMAHAVSPRAGTKEKLIASLNIPADQQSSKIVKMAPRFNMAAAAAVVLLIVSAVFNYIYYNKYNALEAQNKAQSQQLAQLNNHMTDMSRDMNLVRSKYSLPVSLNGLKDAPDAAAKIFWMKNTGEVYVDPGNLPMAPKGMQYQLWGMVDGKPVDGGLITSKDGKTYSIQKMKTFGRAQAFAITLETEGGHPQPKGTMYVMGNI